MGFLKEYWGVLVFGISIVAALMADHFFIQSVRSQVKNLFEKYDALKDKATTLERNLCKLTEHIEMLEKYVIKKQ